MNPFEFATAARIVFGTGKLTEIASIAPEFGSRALIVIGGSVERARSLIAMLEAVSIGYETLQVTHEPDLALVKTGADLARVAHCDMVIAFGGGSAIDTAKAVAALTTNPGDPLDYLEVIGKGQPLAVNPLPLIAIPTTAGTGAEVTRNAVLASPDHKVKVSLRHPLLLPRVALLDPELTYDLPPNVTAYTGMDALTQVIEPYVSPYANPLTDALCREGIQRGFPAIYEAYNYGDHAAREAMALTSLFGGLALANAKLGAVHGFAGVIGGMFDAPHGAICAALLPYVTAVNVHALDEREPNNHARQRYAHIAQMVVDQADPVSLAEWIAELIDALGIPPLSSYGITRDAFPAIVAKSKNSSSMKGNPITLTDAELTEILDRAL